MTAAALRHLDYPPKLLACCLLARCYGVENRPAFRLQMAAASAPLWRAGPGPAKCAEPEPRIHSNLYLMLLSLLLYYQYTRRVRLLISGGRNTYRYVLVHARPVPSMCGVRLPPTNKHVHTPYLEPYT